MEPNPKYYYIQKYEECECQRSELLAFVELVATNKQLDGTSNYAIDTLECMASTLLKKLWCIKSAQIEGDSEVGVGFPSDTNIKNLKRCENCNNLVDTETNRGHGKYCDFVWGMKRMGTTWSI